MRFVNVTEADLPGVLLIEPRRYSDERGYFQEIYQRARYTAAGLPDQFVQDNLSFSKKGVLRGLHYQHPKGQGKLVSVLHGEVFDVAVDLRRGSPTFGRWQGLTLSAENGRQLYLPEGLAHGFVVTGRAALFQYKCTRPYAPDCEHTVAWDDPALGIDWPVGAPVLSEKDASAPRLDELPEAALPAFNATLERSAGSLGA